MGKLRIQIAFMLCLGIAGCKATPAYVATYEFGGVAKMKQTFDLASPSLSTAERARNQKFLKSTAEMTLTIKADGTWAIHNPARGADVNGTYTVEGDKMTLTEAGASGGSSRSLTYTFREADGTLTSGDGTGNPDFRKKK